MDAAAARAYLPLSLAAALDADEAGPYPDNATFMRDLEALSTLQVAVYKLSSEVGSRVLSHTSDNFGDGAAPLVQGALSAAPALAEWVRVLEQRVERRGALPLAESGLPPRLVRVCGVYDMSPADRKIFCGLVMQRTTHAFTPVKLGLQSNSYTSQSKAGVMLASILGVTLTELFNFQKPERRHVKQGIVMPSSQVLWEMPTVLPEAVLFVLGLTLNESQLFNIEKCDLMSVLREEPDYVAKPLPDRRQHTQQPRHATLRLLLAPHHSTPLNSTPHHTTPHHTTPHARAHTTRPPHLTATPRHSTTTRTTPLHSTPHHTTPHSRSMEVAAEAAKAEKAGMAEKAETDEKIENAEKLETATGKPEAMAVDDEATAEAPRKMARRDEADSTAASRARLSTPTPEGEGEAKGGGGAVDGEGTREDKEEDVLKVRSGRYESDLEYLQEMFQLVKLRSDVARVRRNMEERGQQLASSAGKSGASEGEASDDGDIPPLHVEESFWGIDDYAYDMESLARNRFGRNMRHEASKQARHESKRARKLQMKADRLQERIAGRLQQMVDGGMRLPRLERLAAALGLTDFEKNVVVAMIGQAIAPRSIGIMGGGVGGGGSSSPSKTMQVEVLLRCFSASLQQQIKHRCHFYKSAVLVREGILVLHGDELGADLTQTLAEIDRRMLDFVVGLDTEFSELMDGSHLYTPTVNVEEVVLSESKKKLVLDTVRHFDTFTQASKNLDLHKRLAYGRGMVLLFYGPSGTGKTMMANALARLINKKVLMINFPQLGANAAGAVLKLVFREAKIHDAILFFDECESIFMDRTKGNMQVNTVLTELERHEGLCVLATNRPMDLDEAMHRRITLAIEFTKPDQLLREQIWRSMHPPKLQLADDVDFMALARKYELSGGFIKNAWLTALSISVAREGLTPTVTQADLHEGAAHQLRGRLAMSNFDRGVVPRYGLENVILPSSVKEKLKQIVNYQKAQAVLFGQWGFEKQHGRAQGISALFHGPPGTGKTMAAEAIGFDVGRPLLVVNCAQLIDKYVGESAKNIERVFDEAKNQDAVLVFDEAEGLFAERSNDGGSTNRHDNLNVGVLLHHMETFSGVVVAITNRYAQVDSAFHRRFKFILEFALPDGATRSKLWRKLIPDAAPLEKDVDFEALGDRFELSGGSIKSAVFRAAVEASLQSDVDKRLITMEALRTSAQEEVDKEEGGKRLASMYM
ncbi:hypothetical protein AB1Y20_014482 [Prymnesium parvum]|uniref:AAA+ ATPase domain-containing protein n=1 Tax=Prymnesium parvum TaxID=97485 RepID=A0AB34IG02_PRYPA